MTTQRHTIALVLKHLKDPEIVKDVVVRSLASQVHLAKDEVTVLDPVVGIGTVVLVETPTVDQDALWHQWIHPLCSIKYDHEIVDVRIDKRGIKPDYFTKGW